MSKDHLWLKLVQRHCASVKGVSRVLLLSLLHTRVQKFLNGDTEHIVPLVTFFDDLKQKPSHFEAVFKLFFGMLCVCVHFC